MICQSTDKKPHPDSDTKKCNDYTQIIEQDINELVIAEVILKTTTPFARFRLKELLEDLYATNNRLQGKSHLEAVSILEQTGELDRLAGDWLEWTTRHFGLRSDPSRMRDDGCVGLYLSCLIEGSKLLEPLSNKEDAIFDAIVIHSMDYLKTGLLFQVLDAKIRQHRPGSTTWFQSEKQMEYCLSLLKPVRQNVNDFHATVENVAYSSPAIVTGGLGIDFSYVRHIVAVILEDEPDYSFTRNLPDETLVQFSLKPVNGFGIATVRLVTTEKDKPEVWTIDGKGRVAHAGMPWLSTEFASFVTDDERLTATTTRDFIIHTFLQAIFRRFQDIRHRKNVVIESEIDLLGEEDPDFDYALFDNVSDVVAWATKEFRETLVFLGSAIDSASNCPYRHPIRLAQLLMALDRTTRKLQQQEGRLGETWEKALDDYGFEYKDKISDTAASKYGAEYTFLYKGRMHFFPGHVTLGGKQAQNCMSVHFIRDEQNYKLIVGWCGRHLATTRS
jgi:hypothetical protein